ncbi:MAG: DUF1440 domain-containing protein [Gammaproteobacteria bacterium]|nr:DUF1440 domain-containing protein [Gammaproteobacteria bacterium]
MINKIKTSSAYMFITGVVAGVLSALLKSGVETILPPRGPDMISPPVEMLIKLGINANSEVYYFSGQSVNWGGNGVHILFSVVAACIYCSLCRLSIKFSYCQGIAFGLVVCIGAHAVLLPMLGLSSSFFSGGLNASIAEIVSTILWAWSIEIIRIYMLSKKLIDSES